MKVIILPTIVRTLCRGGGGIPAYVALSQEKSEEILRKRIRGSGGDGSAADNSGLLQSTVEEFPTLS